MAISYKDFRFNFFANFKHGDNAVHNSRVLSRLVETNEDGIFNKLIVVQAAALIELCALQIFDRVNRHTNEGVPSITAEDLQDIRVKTINKFKTIIDNLAKYEMLKGSKIDVYDELHKLRDHRNKVHIQEIKDLASKPVDESTVFTAETVRWALELLHTVLYQLQINFPRPKHIEGYVQPLRLPTFD